MKKFVYFCFSVIYLLVSVSCGFSGNRENSRLLQQVTLLVESNPDSALTILNVVDTLKLNKEKKAEYILLRTQGRSNAGMDLSSETDIFEVRKFFIQRNDSQKSALVCFYAGLVSFYRNDATNAMGYYLEALDFAKNIDNLELLAKILYNIGDLNNSNGLYIEALVRFSQALENYQKLEDRYEDVATTLNIIANSMLILERIDSAQYYWQRALNIAKLNKDSSLLCAIYNNMGVAFQEKGQLDTATIYIRKALNVTSSYDQNRFSLYMNLSSIFSEQKCTDSAKHYLDLAEQLIEKIDDKYLKASFSNSCYLMEKAAANYEKALEYLELNLKQQLEILKNYERKQLMELQRKYDLKAKENELNKIKTKYGYIIGTVGAISLLLSLIIVFLQIRNKRQKANFETIEQIWIKRDNEMKIYCLEKLGIIKELAIVAKKHESDSSTFASKIKIITSQFNPQKIQQITNELYPGFVDFLTDYYREIKMTDHEIAVCCMFVCGFSNNEVAILTNYKKKMDTFSHWKTQLRQKLNMTPKEDFQKYLLTNYNNFIRN